MGITIEGTYNARAFGPSDSPWLVRAANLDEITDAGIAELARLNLALVLDLREEGERGAVRHGIPLQLLPIYRSAAGAPVTGTLEEVYESLLYTRGAELTAAVDAIANATGPVLVHCAAGKDRTGLVIALALRAAGWTESDVIADYVLSASDVRLHRSALTHEALRALDLTSAEYSAALRLHLDSPEGAIRYAFQLIARTGGVERYLLHNGLSPESLELLSSKSVAA